MSERTTFKPVDEYELNEVARFGGSPARTRRSKKATLRAIKQAAKRGKRRSSPGGIHQRRNKRPNW